jgi:hypothetical protein
MLFPQRRQVDRASPLQRLILDISLAELPGDLGPRQLDAEIKSVRAVVLDAEAAEEVERAGGDAMLRAVVDVDPVARDFDAEIGIADLRHRLGDLLGRVGEGTPVAQPHQARVDIDGQTLEARRRMHEPARAIGLANGAAAMRAHLHHQHVVDGELGDDAEEQRVDAGGVGIGELRDVADAHENARSGQPPAQLRVAQDRGGEAEGNGIEDRIEDEGPAAALEPLDGAENRIEVAGLRGDDHRHRRRLLGEGECLLAEAQKEIGAATAAAPQLLGVGGIDADLETRFVQRGDRLFHLRERRCREAAEIDHIGTVGGKAPRFLQDRLDRERRRFDDLGEDANRARREIDTFSGLSEMLRQIVEIDGAALDRHAQDRAKLAEIAAAMSGHDDAVRPHCIGETAADEIGGHERRDLQADVPDGPGEVEVVKGAQHLAQPLLGEVTRQEKCVARHGSTRSADHSRAIARC